MESDWQQSVCHLISQPQEIHSDKELKSTTAVQNNSAMKIAKRFLLLNLVFVVLFFVVVKWFVFGSMKSLDTQWIKNAGLHGSDDGDTNTNIVYDKSIYNRVRFNESSRFVNQLRLFSHEIDLEFSLYNGDGDGESDSGGNYIDNDEETAWNARYASKSKRNGRKTPKTIRRFVIVTTWRSGSTFLGEIFNELSGNYYHYEPLMNFDIRQVRTGSEAEQAVLQLERLFRCDYRHLDEFVDYASHHENVFTHNTRLWQSCNRDYNDVSTNAVVTNETKSTKLCYDLDFLSDFCALHPFQSMKLVRLRLILIETLIQRFNLNIVFLVRDPRGVMESRKHRDWCPGNSDCDNSSFLCQDMITDYYTMLEFQRQYPNNFAFVKFEEMATNPINYTRKLFKQLRIPFTLRIESYINNHSKYNYGGVSSTYRDSKTVPFMWMEKLTKSEIVHIQNQCTEALKLYNYTFYF